MIRVSVPRRGLLRPTPLRRLWWGYREADLHRLARQRPWWENIALITGTVAVVLIAAIGHYFGNRLYYLIRPAGNDLFVIQELDLKVFSRPDLSVALVKMAAHHLFSQTTTPFGAPMVAPVELKPEAEELYQFIRTLHEQQPQFSIPDLWVLACSKALERMGGPMVVSLRGRPNQQSLVSTEMLTFPPSTIDDQSRDPLTLKRMLVQEGLSLDEMVALVGGVRNIGYHNTAQLHHDRAEAELKPANLRQARDMSVPSEETKIALATRRKCTQDPFVFGGEYFSLLLDYKWRAEAIPMEELSVERALAVKEAEKKRASSNSWKKVARWIGIGGSGTPSSSSSAQEDRKDFTDHYFVCRETERRRNDVLIDPLSSNYLTKEKRKFELNAKELRDAVAADAAQQDARDAENLALRELHSPCPSISMEGIDMGLLDDALTHGWVRRFSENELKFYTSFGKVMEKIFASGYNPNELYKLKG